MEIKKDNIVTSSRRKHITYLGGCWPTNIGNAFIDLGSIQSLKMADPNAVVHFASEMPEWFFYSNRKNFRHSFDLAQTMESDYIVVSGMLLCDEFIRLYEPVISVLIKRGVKFIINGGGGAKYNRKEIENFRNFLKRNSPYAFISRDEHSFENYKDLAKYSYSGLDCGFFVNDYFKPAKLNLAKFVVFNFDEHGFRKILKLAKSKLFLKKFETPVPMVKDKLIIRAHHSCWKNIPRSHFLKPKTLISDIPDDYLNLYANAEETYSDRVHACVATLTFGHPAMLLSQTPRAYLFAKVGADTIKKRLTYPNMKKILEEKRRHLKFLSYILS